MFDADLAFSTPTGVHAEANFAKIVSDPADGTGAPRRPGTRPGRAPNTDIIGDRVTLTQLIQGISDPSTVIATPAFSGGGALTFSVGKTWTDPLADIPSLIPLDDGLQTHPDHRGLLHSFAASVNSASFSSLSLGSLGFDMRVNVPGAAKTMRMMANLADAATSADTTDAYPTRLLNTAIQNALNAAFGPDYTGAVPQLVRADIVASGSGYRLAPTAL